MNIYKEAQEVRFANPDGLREKLQKIRDSQYGSYISVLSQIHTDMQSPEADLESVINEAVDSYFVKAIMLLIRDIGEQVFVGTDFALLTDEMANLRNPQEELQLGFIPGISNKQPEEVRFANPDGLREKLQKIRDSQYGSYISVLSQIHTDMQSPEADLESVINEAVDSYFTKAIMLLISDIGEQVFVDTDFALLTNEMAKLRNTQEELQRGSIPGISNKQPEVRQPRLLEPHYLLELSSEERIKYFTNLTYPEKYGDRPSFMIQNGLKFIEGELADEEFAGKEFAAGSIADNIRNKKRYKLKKELIDTMSTLISMAKGEFEIEDPEMEAEEEDKEEGTSNATSLPSKPSWTKGRKNNSEEKSAFLGTTLEEDSIYEQDLFNNSNSGRLLESSNNPYVNFAVYPPEVDYDSMYNVFGKFVTKIEELWNFMMSRGVPDASMKRAFNDLAFSIKMADFKTYKEFKERRKIALSLGNNDPKVWADLEKNLKAELPSRMIINNEDFGYTIKAVSTFISSPKIGRILYVEKDEKKLQKYFSINESIISGEMVGRIKEGMDVSVGNSVSKKLDRYFDLEDRYGYKNLIDILKLRWNYVLYNELDKEFNQQSYIEYKPCPTCFKYIPWRGSGGAKLLQTGFSVRLYSFFTADEERPRITKELLNSRKWPAPLPSDYSGDRYERERNLVTKYGRNGDKSWDEIQTLLNSSLKEEQMEGWFRRSGALRAAGGVPLGSAPRQVQGLMTECPFESSSSEKSDCGISYAPQGNATLPRGLSLQPTWNGLKTNEIKGRDGEIPLKKELWENKELYQEASNLKRGGYKFSSTNFACTCRIKELSDLTSYKHGNIAISKPGVSGSPGFVYPTTPDGSLNKKMQPGTLAFLVCGTPTSLSSFDRDSESAGYILQHFQKIRDESINDYKIMFSHLIKMGLNPDDLMDLDENLDKYTRQKKEELTKSTQARMKRLVQIIKNSAKQMSIDSDSEIKRLIGGLTLVCPFGHKFTINHSLKFGEAYASIYQKDNTAALFTDIILSEGDANIKSLLKPITKSIGARAKNLFIKADDPEMSGFEKLHYEEWMKREDRTVYPLLNERKRPILIFTLPVNIDGTKEDFVLHQRLSKSNIWPSNKSFYLGDAKSSKLNMGTIDGEKTALSIGEQVETLAGNVSVEQDIGYDFLEPPAHPIPGTVSINSKFGNPRAMGQKIDSLSLAFKSALRMIEVWTKGLLNDKMVNTILDDRDVDISLYSDKIDSSLVPYYDQYKVDENQEDVPLDAGELNQLRTIMKTTLVSIINRKATKLYDAIRSNIYSIEDDSYNVEISKKIIKASISEMLGEIYHNHNGGSIFFNVKQSEEEAFALRMAELITSNNPKIVKEIVLGSKRQIKYEEERKQYIGRIVLVSYARFLAKELSRIYNRYYANKDSYFYVGYDLGIDLSSPSNILGTEMNGEWVGGLTKEKVDSITSTLEEAGISKNIKERVDVTPGTLMYEERMDNAWIDLKRALSRATKEAMSAKSMEESKNYIVSRLSFITENPKASSIRKRVDNVFPSRTLMFNGRTDNPETGISHVIKRRLPLLFAKKDKVISILNEPAGKKWVVVDVRTKKNLGEFDTRDEGLEFEKELLTQGFSAEYLETTHKNTGSKLIIEWVLRDANLNKVLGVFPSQEEAEAKKSEVLSKNPDASLELRNDQYYVNDRLGYDGSKNQIGITAGKRGNEIQWPPPLGGWNFVSINLPFDVAGQQKDARINLVKEVPIQSYKFEIDFDGPLDISFLLRRGSSGTKKNRKDSFNAIRRIEREIVEAYSVSNNKITNFKQSNAREIAEDESIFTRFISIEKSELEIKVNSLLKRIEAFPLQLNTTNSYVDLESMRARPMLRVSLEDPITAYNLIKNPEARGMIISKEDQERYLQFIIKVFNIDLIRDMIVAYGKKGGKRGKSTKKSLIFANATSEDLLANPDKYKISSGTLNVASWINQDGEKRKGYGLSGGQYYNVIPGSPTSNRGSYLNYVYSASPQSTLNLNPGEHPSITRLQGASDYIKKYKLSGKHQAEEKESALMGQKIQDGMIEYITSMTSGERDSPAWDGFKTASKYSKQILLRQSKLHRMILSLGTFDFSDVEMPRF